MSSRDSAQCLDATNVEEDSPTTILPPQICNNPRKKIKPELVDANFLELPHKTREKPSKHLVTPPFIETVPLACPKAPLAIIWSPDRVYFELDEEPIIRKLWIWNACSRMIYIHCCGLWNDMARLGASWRTYPRTRFLLAPGLKTELTIKATPRSHSPVPGAVLCLQLAASHKRDHVTGYFAVPVVANFLKYIPSVGDEQG